MILCHNKTVLDGLNLYGYQNLVSIPLKILGIVSYRIVLVSYRIVLVSYRFKKAYIAHTYKFFDNVAEYGLSKAWVRGCSLLLTNYVLLFKGTKRKIQLQ